MKFEAAKPEHIPLIQDAFDAMREDRRRRFVDYLAEPGVTDFHRDRLVRSIEENKATFEVVFDGDRLAAIIGIQQSAFHTNHYGVPYYKIQPGFWFTNDYGVVSKIAQALQQKMQIPERAVYTTRVDADESNITYALCEQGFRPVGTSVRMVLRDQELKNQIDRLHERQYDNFQIRNAGPQDVDALKRIGGSDHAYSHFFHEAKFPQAKTQELFAIWTQKSAEGMADAVIVIEQDGEIAGFCSLLSNNALLSYINLSIGVIDFIVVDSRFQGKGLGSLLLGAALEWFQGKVNRIELRTMAENVKAIRFYQTHGFRLLSADQHLHYWTDSP
ncbi:MAG: GNAT family N-acetyltransferase [Candidatus Hinthialibacter antarcticus]|nr:GNAT family N-acetyltransferase [Candidatus Hinthialibacter antarcticus]